MNNIDQKYYEKMDERTFSVTMDSIDTPCTRYPIFTFTIK